MGLEHIHGSSRCHGKRIVLVQRQRRKMLEPQSPLSRIANTPGASQPSAVSPKQLAMSVLFGASVVGYLITRSQNDVWKTASMPGLPLGLVASTLLLLALSTAMHLALRAV